MQKMLFSMATFIKSILLNLIKLIEVNMEMVVISNMKLLNIEVKIVLYQQKDIVLLNVLISKQVKITNNILNLLEMKKDDEIL